METIEAVNRLIAAYKKLPGIGNKTAERLAYATLSFKPEVIEEMVGSLENVVQHVHLCPKCGMPIDTPFCPICDDKARDSKTLLVVTDAKNVISFEKTGKYHGKYFVLGGSISPIKGIGPEEIRIPQLKELVNSEHIEEVIMACSSTVEGELTAGYISNYLSDLPVKVSRLAYGLPVGADIEYVDELTIERSLNARVNMKGNK
jgi:recombination protein RecR